MDRTADPSFLARPLFKWSGSKRAIAAELAKRLPPTLATAQRRYVEPFAGSAALFFYLRARGLDMPAVLADSNADLVNVYAAIAREPEAVAAWLEIFARGSSKGKFYLVRQAWNRTRELWTDARRAAGFIYLNRACFNGLWRVNAAGEFNVPYGQRASLAIPDREHVSAFARALAGVTLKAHGFVATLSACRPGDVVYCDPPYLPTSATSSFVGYDVGGFSTDDHELLASMTRELVRRGVWIMISNSDTPLARELYADPIWQIETISAPRRIAADATKRGDVRELLITPHPRWLANAAQKDA